MAFERATKFNSYAILDLETANLPHLNGNKVGITEIAIYGVAVEEFDRELGSGKVPDLPRILHKLTMLINPRMAVALSAERVTGLNNEMLEHESSFNKNAANTVLSFLSHLREPICLVSHNGWVFDFPIVRRVLEKVEMTMPDTVYCIDTLRAFHDIDVENFEKRKNTDALESAPSERSIGATADIETIFTILAKEKTFDTCAQNETTPKRPTVSSVKAAKTRKLIFENNEIIAEECQIIENAPHKSKRALNFSEAPSSSQIIENGPHKSKRALNFSEAPSSSVVNISYLMPAGKKWYPPKTIYKLGKLYERIFKESSQQHHAEADVIMLTKLMLHYGKDFVNYAEKHSRPFNSIPRLGKNIL